MSKRLSDDGAAPASDEAQIDYARRHATSAVNTLSRFLQAEYRRAEAGPAKVIYYNEEGGPLYAGMYTMGEAGALAHGMWSDTFGIYLMDYSLLTAKSPQACSQCDTDRAQDDGFCEMWSVVTLGIGIGATVIAAATVSATGPGAAIAFGVGVNGSMVLATAVNWGCRANAASRHAACRASSC